MDAWRFDALTRALGAAGTRRLVLTAAGGALSAFLSRSPREASAACGLVGSPCNHESDCCGVAVCRNHHCRCKKGWSNCNQQGICRHLTSNPDHCGECGNACSTPCCIKGKCKESCGDDGCCADCFAEADGLLGPPHEGTEFCCASKQICGTGDPADDLCCWPTQVCLDGNCCCDGCDGTEVCGGTCCPTVSCCNGKCCKNGEVCARPKPNKPKTCVKGVRDCTNDGDCFGNEECRGGICCSGVRACFANGPGSDPICCPVTHHCDPEIKACCKNGSLCHTSKKVRIRV